MPAASLPRDASSAEPKRQKTEEPENGEEKPESSENDDSSSGGDIPDAAQQAGVLKMKIPNIPFSLEALRVEVEELRGAMPPYASELGELFKPAMVCGERGVLEEPGEEGPWDLTVCVRGAEEDPAYGFPFRVRLRFDHDLWPSKLAVVRFQCVFHHGLTDEEGAMLIPFYKGLPRDDRGACTVRLMVQAVHTFLRDPLASWKIPADMAPEKIRGALDAHREVNQDRFSVIGRYSMKYRHPELFERPPRWRDEWLAPEFRQARQEGTAEAWRSILSEDLPGEVFSFRLFTDAFLDLLVDEIFNFYGSGLPARRPNSMNAYGIILNEIGLEPLIDALQQQLQPLGRLLFPGPGSAWDGHHCFIVRYRGGEDLGLDMHTDDSDVTFNVCLGLEFTAAGLQFCGRMGAPNHRKHTYTYNHVKGRCVCHLGRKRHGADDITSGERLNLILWNHGSAYRECDEYVKPDYQKEDGPPDEVCVSYTHDRDYGNFKEYPLAKEKHRGKGWCPRRTFEYEGFKADCEVEKEGS